MKVYNIGTSEQELIIEALEWLADTEASALKNEADKKEAALMEYQLAHTITTTELLSDQRLQELCERCLSYFADRLFDGGSVEWPEVESLADDMGLDDEELKELFREAGYGEE